MRFTLAPRMATAAINIRSMLHRGARSATVLAVLIRGAGAIWMSALFWCVRRHITNLLGSKSPIRLQTYRA